ncbi:MAG: flagellar hook protein FlgE [Gammaproteobacteria bacterium]
MSFKVALSGINSASADLDVISNNLANLSSTGYKVNRAEFASLVGVAGATAEGVVQGRGAELAAVTRNFSQGNLESTGNALDVAIQGNGFLVMSDAGALSYSRNGALTVDKNGFVVNSAGHRAQAFQPDLAGNITSNIGDLTISTADSAPQASTTLDTGINLDASESIIALPFDINDASTYHSTSSATIFDSLGVEHVYSSFFTKTGANTWNMHAALDGVVASTNNVMTFSPAGALTAPASGQFTIPLAPGGGAAAQNLVVDFSQSTQFGSPFSVNTLEQDGFATGRLIDVNIGSEGVVLARYSNGQSIAQGQITLANFANLQGLSEGPFGSWLESPDSGVPLIGSPGTASLGLLQAGALESSNVDVTEMLVNLITAQRNFQSNAKTIETTDSLTQTIMNIR